MSGPDIVRVVRVRVPHGRAGEADRIGREVARAVGESRIERAPPGSVAVADMGPPSVIAAGVARRLAR